ncbi:hypothetical protein DFQ30_003719 [Apophysomyces sp. BC1015]|nr:hypothetical protein DFQ30_003719 [Apophysomyces sp. BC1015]
MNSFLHIAKINDICDAPNMKFMDRLVCKADGTADLVGELQANVTLAISYAEERKKRKFSAPSDKSATDKEAIT